MNRLWAGVIVPAALAAAVVTTAGGRTAILGPFNGSCDYTGSGTTYTLNVTIPGTSPTIGGFAIGAGGITVTTFTISGNPSTPGSGGLPSGTSFEAFVQNAIAGGSTVVITVVTSAPVAGPFTIFETNSPPSDY